MNGVRSISLRSLRNSLLRTSRRRYATIAFSGNATYAAIAFVGSVLSARLLGVDGKGEYTAWTLGSTTGALLVAGSLPTGLGRTYLLGTRTGLFRAAAIYAALIAPAVLVASVVAWTVGVDATPLLFCIVVAVPAILFTLNVIVVMQAAKRASAYLVIRAIQALVVTVGFLLLVAFQPRNPLAAAFFIWGAATLASAAVAAYFASRDAGGAGRGQTAGGAKTLLLRARSLGRGSYAARLIDWLMFRFDQFAVVALVGPAGLGAYSVAVNWSEIGVYLGHALGDSVFEDERTLSGALVRKVLLQVLRALLVASLLIVATGVVLIEPLFGAPFFEAKPLLLLLLPGIVARALGYTSSQILMAQGRSAELSKVMTRSLVIGVVLVVLLTIWLGVYGAAIGSSATYVIQMLLAIRTLIRRGSRHAPTSPSNSDTPSSSRMEAIEPS